MLERANYQDHKIYNDVRSSIDFTFKSVFENYEKNKTPDLINDPIFTQCFGGSIKLENEPSQYFAKSFMENYKGRFNTIPEIGDYGNPYCVLLAKDLTKDNLEFLEKNMDPKDLIAYSSNSGHKLPENRKSTLFEERATGTEHTSLARGNLNYMSNLVRFGYQMRNDYNIGAISREDLERYNLHSNIMFSELAAYILENRNNPEVIKEVNYMLNCPIYIKEGYCTTLADFVKNEIELNEKLTDSEREVLKKFAKVTGIEVDQNLNVPGLKLMNAEEAIARYGTTIEKEVKTGPEFRLEMYGAGSVTPEELSNLTKKELKKITINEKALQSLVDCGFSDFNNLTLTPKAFNSIKSINRDNNVDKLSINGINIKTFNQEIDNDTFKTMYDSSFKDFVGAVFIGDFSDENKKKILEIMKFDETIKSIDEKSDIKQIKSYVDNISSAVNDYGLKNILHEDVVNKFNKIKTFFDEYNEKDGFFLKRKKQSDLTKAVKEFKNMDMISGRSLGNSKDFS